MKLWLSGFAVLLVLSLATQCSTGPCPSHIVGVVQEDHAGLGLGSPPHYLVATLQTVKAECLGYQAGNQGAPGPGTASQARYQIASTATLTYVINNKEVFEQANRLANYDLRAQVKFEALTSNGVVLASATGAVTFTPGVGADTVSARIVGLTSAEARRIQKIEVRWLYDR